MATLPSRVQQLADQVAAAHGVEVLEVHLRRQGRTQVLMVVVDADQPVEADLVEQLSKELSRALDAADPLPGSYTLEVTTPGLERPLRTARDFRRQLGHEVRVVRAAAGAGQTATVQGVVTASDERAVTLDVGGELVEVLLADVVRGKVVLPW
jgi:ribosome maturation factor RimP